MVCLTAGPKPSLAADAGCGGCHRQAPHRHASIEVGCAACHKGRADADTLEQGHSGLIARPGELDNAAATCGGCHAQQWSGVQAGRMHTGRGMVEVTREVFGEPRGTAPSLQGLGQGPADSLLRKLCASCHLGQPGRPLSEANADPIHQRGGGCLACHLESRQRAADGAQHPRLSRQVADARCVGCHSRSGRISLNYAGLAEVDPPVPREDWRGLSRLADGRLVAHRPADVHQRAGLGCVDCHTGPGLMGQTGGVDIACTDCHDNRWPRLAESELSVGQTANRRELGIAPDRAAELWQTANATPLWHVELRPAGSGVAAWLYPKAGGPPRLIPQLEAGHFEAAERHARLSCAACHAAWAPQCYGCHLEYDPSGTQWDHVEQRATAGRWSERRWNIRNDRPPLGVDGEDRVRPVVPGMIATIEHPAGDGTLFVRRFAAVAPHTTGRSRRCNDCHGAPIALGLGDGLLEQGDDGWRLRPRLPVRADGLAADAWTSIDAGPSLQTEGEDRPFSAEELRRLLPPIE